MRKAYQTFAGVVSAGVLSLLALISYVQLTIPDRIQVLQGEEIALPTTLATIGGQKDIPAGVDLTEASSYDVDLRLFGKVPVKQLEVEVIDQKLVVPGGIPFGIKMFTDGIMVVGMSDIQNGSENVSPAKDAGLKVGDILLSIDDTPLERNGDVSRYISACEGNEVKITLNRDGMEMDVYVQPIESQLDGGYKAGIWVRDSSAGIGTMTYYDPQTLAFAGLGHAICDVDTGNIMPMSSGEIVDVNISGANAGHSGKPGELKGTFVGDEPIGALYINCENGIYGILNRPASLGDAVPLALKQEIEPGPATILSTISGNKPQSFDILIEKVSYSDTGSTKNMVIKVVDPSLLETTGGIVQGMSGSPILQNGKLVGAVTHVFVNDPTRGYGIFAENMEKTRNNVESKHNAA